MLHFSISLRALVFVMVLGLALLIGSDVAQGAPSTTPLTDIDDLLFSNPGQNGARDVHTAFAAGNANLGGVRIYAGNSLSNPPTTAALQFFGNGHTVFPGQAFIDSGAHNNAAIIFRTAQAGQGVGERMRITADGKVGIADTSPNSQLSVRSNDNIYATIYGTALGDGDGVVAQAIGSGDALVAIAATGRAGDFHGKVKVENDVSIGFQFQEAGNNRLHVKEFINDSATPANHVAQIQNTSSNTSGDVLALKVDYTGNPLDSNNFITFFNGNDTSLGAIQGNGSGGVVFAGPGNDYAEWLRRRDASEEVRSGDIVGVFAGEVSRTTLGASQTLVVSSSPIVAGNDPGEDSRSGHALVAFIGQAPVRVRGAVRSGDFIVASGDGDGVGVAVAPESITDDQVGLIVGQAWQSSDDDGEKLINVAVGLQRNPAISRLITSNQEHAARIASLESRLAAIEQMLSGSPAPLLASR